MICLKKSGIWCEWYCEKIAKAPGEADDVLAAQQEEAALAKAQEETVLVNFAKDAIEEIWSYFGEVFDDAKNTEDAEKAGTISFEEADI